MSYPFVLINGFTPNKGDWTSFGNAVSHQQQGNTISRHNAGGFALNISFPGTRAFRVRFAPAPNPNYGTEISYAVVPRNLGAVTLRIQDLGDHLVVGAGAMTVRIDVQPCRICISRGSQHISDRLAPAAPTIDTTEVFGTESCVGCHDSSSITIGFKKDLATGLELADKNGIPTPVYGENNHFGKTGNASFSWMLQQETKARPRDIHDPKLKVKN
jgi:hypothetical protein